MNPFSQYPSPSDVDAYWAKAASEVPASPAPVERRGFDAPKKDRQYDFHTSMVWLQFRGVDGIPFWCVWQRSANRGKSKTLVHVPGYGTEVSLHPYFCHAGYNVLHVNPRGYCGPDGMGNPEWRLKDSTPDVMIHNLDDTERYGYRAWIQDGLIAVRWLLNQMEPGSDEAGVLKNPIGFYGTSQGGGGALALASVAKEFGSIVGAVAADEPFLTGFAMVHGRTNLGAYAMALNALDAEKDERRRRAMVRSMGMIDSHSHAHRMTYPVLLTAGDQDLTCPSDTIHALYEKLPCTRSITSYANMGHGYTFGFPRLAHAWFDLYL